MAEGDEGIVLMGLMRERQAERFLPNGEFLTSSSGSDTKYYQATSDLIPRDFIGNAAECVLTIRNTDFHFRGLVSDAYMSVPYHLPPGFGRAHSLDDRVPMLLAGEKISIQDANTKEYLKKQWQDSLPIELPSAETFGRTGNIWGLPYQRVTISLESYISLDVPVMALYAVTTLSASESLDAVSSMLPPGAWMLEPDFDDFYITNERLRYAQMIEKSMEQGIVPFYTLLLLSQMAIWGVWMDRFLLTITNLHIIGCSYVRQAFTLLMTVILMIILAFCLGGTLFTALYPSMNRWGLLWRFDSKAFLWSSLAFLCTHILYFFVWIGATMRKLKRSAQT